MWTGKPANYSFLRVFGCEAYYHVNEGKLVPRAKKGYFVGYPSGVKGFRIWCPEEKKCIISRDVTFQENDLYKSPRSPIDQLSDQKDLERFDLEVEPWGDKDAQLEDDQTAETDRAEEQILPEEDQPAPQDYNLTRDRVRRNIKPPQRYGYADMISYALQVAEDVDLDEPRSFAEAVKEKIVRNGYWPWQKS